MTRADKISTWLRDRAMSAGSQGYVFGLSGGIDSAVVARTVSDGAAAARARRADALLQPSAG
jgi:NH3-dependent NAD+ synthetase